MKAIFLFAAICMASPIVITRHSDDAAVIYPDVYLNKEPSSVKSEESQEESKRATEDVAVYPDQYWSNEQALEESKDEQAKTEGQQEKAKPEDETLVTYPEAAYINVGQ